MGDGNGMEKAKGGTEKNAYLIAASSFITLHKKRIDSGTPYNRSSYHTMTIE
jgi:hypothetical protein